jgi:hypothetical protein
MEMFAMGLECIVYLGYLRAGRHRCHALYPRPPVGHVSDSGRSEARHIAGKRLSFDERGERRFRRSHSAKHGKLADGGSRLSDYRRQKEARRWFRPHRPDRQGLCRSSWFPEFADRINAIQTRLFDLLPVVREHTYHPS